MEKAHERKKLKYDDLQGQCQTSCLPIEMSARGFTAGSLCKALSDIGMIGTTISRAIKSISDTTETTAKWLWIKRISTGEKEN